jgi:PhnB protein
MPKKVKAIPDGYHTVTPYLVVRGGARAIEFYGKAFGAEEVFRMPGPDGAILHAEIRIAGSIVMLSDESPEMGARSPLTLGGTPLQVFLYRDDVDATFRQAIAAGAKEQRAPENQFWGDRMARVSDPFGHEWILATHVEDVGAEELGRRASAAFGGGAS